PANNMNGSGSLLPTFSTPLRNRWAIPGFVFSDTTFSPCFCVFIYSPRFSVFGFVTVNEAAFVSHAASLFGQVFWISAFCVRSCFLFGPLGLNFCFLCPKLLQVLTLNQRFLLFLSEVAPGSDSKPEIFAFSVRSCSRFGL